MTTRMSLDELKALWPPYEPHAFRPIKATRKGFVHKHRPTWKWKPKKAKMSPAKWKWMRRKSIK